jgi:energy-coupling factor transporter ATP-binding protein EcfA2
MSVAFRFGSIDWPATHRQRRTTNPFATRWVRPGAIPYRFMDGASAAAIVERLSNNGWRGAIVGPHGSGKSTLLACLRPLIESAGRAIRTISLHDRQRAVPAEFARAVRGKDRSNLPTMLVVDGYEQLGWRARRQLRAACKGNECGLLATTHRESAAGRLPNLYCTQASLETVQYLVDHVLPSHGGLIEPGDVAAAFEGHQPNVRETLFALYDLFERRRHR